MSARPNTHPENGFTLVELMMVVLILGVLVALAIPIYGAVRSQAEKKTCFANQRTIEGACVQWMGSNGGASGDDLSALAGVINDAHPLVHAYILRIPPRCPSAPAPADPQNPTPAEGAYTLDSSGTVQPCPFGRSGAHGYYSQ